MKLKHKQENHKMLSISVEGHQCPVDPKTGLVSIPDSTTPKTVKHLLSQGWKVADHAAEMKAKEADGDDKGKGGKGGK